MEERRKILHPWSKNRLLCKRNHNKKSCVGILKYNRDDKIKVFDNKLMNLRKFHKNWENGNEKKGRKVETRKNMRILLRKFNIRMTEVI